MFNENDKAVVQFEVDVTRSDEEQALIFIPELNYSLRVPVSSLTPVAVAVGSSDDYVEEGLTTEQLGLELAAAFKEFKRSLGGTEEVRDEAAEQFNKTNAVLVTRWRSWLYSTYGSGLPVEVLDEAFEQSQGGTSDEVVEERFAQLTSFGAYVHSRVK